MSKSSVKEAPAQVKPAIELEVLESISPETLYDGYVYVHCHFENEWQDALIRIWKTTFLVDLVSGYKSRLIHAENISFAPIWTIIADQRTHTFLLIFEALPKPCKMFDLVEEIPQPGGFHVQNIHRNPTDVYHIHI
ncbi:MAG: hypothetical protein QM762_10545 [Chryseolinea sp.]